MVVKEWNKLIIFCNTQLISLSIYNRCMKIIFKVPVWQTRVTFKIKDQEFHYIFIIHTFMYANNQQIWTTVYFLSQKLMDLNHCKCQKDSPYMDQMFGEICFTGYIFNSQNFMSGTFYLLAKKLVAVGIRTVEQIFNIYIYLLQNILNCWNFWNWNQIFDYWYWGSL